MAKHYCAFISYSHADAGFARWLHGRLETYRFPKSVVGTPTGHGPLPARLPPIFRDREELPAATSLTEEVVAALAKSRALVVICSPAAAASQWVNREIELFRELHPDRPILPALVAGEPATAFPSTLLDVSEEAKPLAADFRPNTDGKRLALLKLVAGVADVPLAQLMQRDAQRRLRRVTAVTVAAVALLLVMSAMTYLAIQARNEAEHQRAEAEGLVQYMLTDLRTELRGVGRLDIMSGVNQRVLGYYSAQGDLDDLPDDSLQWWARTLHAISEDEQEACDYDSAIAFINQSHRTTASLLEREPRNPERVFAHAQSEFYVGAAAWQLRELERTETHWRGYLTQARALAELEPDTARSAMELGYAHGNMCEVLGRDPARRAEAIANCRQSIVHVEQAISRDPAEDGYVAALANRLGWLADILVEVEEYDEAFDHRQRELDLLTALLASSPRNFDLQQRAVAPLIGMGEIELLRGHKPEAVQMLSRAAGDLEQLAEQNAETRDSIAATRIRTLLLLARAMAGPDGAPQQRYLNEAREIFVAANVGSSCRGVQRFEEFLETEGETT
ncbi:toll/interleukin-1 receptor domain-containing protein [Aurantiacibacter sp. MUD11]|uniref:toll/interleukin-1 receptor domain-containing protein n=1 Tax=Aurantiacibacter sp. MUD11 TaxID=3003265 RepID=UPI0022A9FF9B|nr:toll/interleukin-1 receptor domain-containing protein [Aurantiacibacter sp. MUD11]WAT18688.1 toll/interleukin-1 receptor domain-containing protein [Aurantiacibacter sp. MUD11]